jgi:hypothetical protein
MPRCLDSHDLLPASLSQTPTPHRRFVENKSQTPIRPRGRPSGRSPFSRFSDPESRCFCHAIAGANLLTTNCHMIRREYLANRPNHSATISECKTNFTDSTGCPTLSFADLATPWMPHPLRPTVSVLHTRLIAVAKDGFTNFQPSPSKGV